jgi:hypothetical protein
MSSPTKHKSDKELLKSPPKSVYRSLSQCVYTKKDTYEFIQDQLCVETKQCYNCKNVESVENVYIKTYKE